MTLQSPKTTHQEMVVTPELAARWLERNRNNRSLRRNKVAQYADDMKNGRWRDNGDTIRFSINGDLIDGQHRLHALIAADVSLVLWIVEGVADEARMTIDSGVVRRIGDRLRMFGSVQRANTVAASLFIIDQWIMEEDGTPSGERLMQWYELMTPGFEWALTAIKSKRLLMAPVYAALVYAWESYPIEVAYFTAQLETGEGLRANDPALMLREYLGNTSERSATPERRWSTFLKTLRAAQAFVLDQSVTKLMATESALAFFGSASRSLCGGADADA